MIEEFGPNYEGKPVRFSLFFGLDVSQCWSQNDMLSWLIDLAPKGELTIPSVSLKVLGINFAAIHTSTMVRDMRDTLHLYLKLSL